MGLGENMGLTIVERGEGLAQPLSLSLSIYIFIENRVCLLRGFGFGFGMISRKHYNGKRQRWWGSVYIYVGSDGELIN